MSSKQYGDDRKAYFLAIIAILLWSTVATAFKLTLPHGSLEEVLFLASLASSVSIFLVIIFRRKKWSHARQLLRKGMLAALLGFVNPFFYYSILFRAYELLPGQIAQPLNYTWPIFLTLFAVPFLGHKISKLDFLVLMLGFAGVVVISSQTGGGTLGPVSLTGVFFALLAAVVWAGYWVLSSRLAAGDLELMFLNFCFGSLYTGLYLLFFVSERSLDLHGFLGAIYIGVIEMGITYCIWLKALSCSSNSAKIGALIYLCPVFSLVFLAAIAGEPMSCATFFGLGLILSGVVVQKLPLTRLAALRNRFSWRWRGVHRLR